MRIGLPNLWGRATEIVLSGALHPFVRRCWTRSGIPLPPLDVPDGGNIIWTMSMGDEAKARKRASDEKRREAEAAAAAALAAWRADVDVYAKEFAVAAAETRLKRRRVGLRWLWIVSVPLQSHASTTEYWSSATLGVKKDGSWIPLREIFAPQSAVRYEKTSVPKVIGTVPANEIRESFVSRL